jgi:hypothetical protein
MGLTSSCRRFTISETLAHRRCECVAGILPPARMPLAQPQIRARGRPTRADPADHLLHSDMAFQPVGGGDERGLADAALLFDGPLTATVTYDIAPADGAARFPGTPPRVRTGWLKLSRELDRPTQ